MKTSFEKKQMHEDIRPKIIHRKIYLSNSKSVPKDQLLWKQHAERWYQPHVQDLQERKKTIKLLKKKKNSSRQ